MGEPESKSLNEFGILVADHVTAMLAYWDKNQICRFANNAYREWFGKTPDQMIGKINMKELLGPLYEKNLPFITEVLKGEKQVFERMIPLPDGSFRHSIASYYPDITDGEVRGFFVHVADVTPIKLLEAKLLDIERTRKREILHSVIETRENERESIAIELRDSISQTLAYCKMMLQNANSKEPANDLLIEIAANIQQAIQELNILSRNLSPSIIRDFGLNPALEDLILNIQNKNDCKIELESVNEIIEHLTHNEKISIFRIIQDYLLMVVTDAAAIEIFIAIHYFHPELVLQISHNDVQFEMPVHNREYKDIQNRIEYYEGAMNEKNEDGRNIVTITLNMTGNKF